MKRISMILFIVLIFGGCSFLNYPEELDMFTKSTNVNYWYFSVGRGSRPSFSFVQITQDNINGISLNLGINQIPKLYTEFKNKTHTVSVYNNKINIQWIKRKSLDANFDVPETFINKPTPSYFKDAFDNSQNTIVIKKKWIKKIEKLSLSYLSWDGFWAEYDLTEAKGMVFVSEDEGKLMFFISPSNDKMIESYFSNDQWDYIRYIEGGKTSLLVNEADPEKIIKTIWDAWQKYIIPYVDYLNTEYTEE